ncbi:carbohydrate kinase [Staphylococcus chromogenes]|uniref:carbohydrate kinase family protein n=1 Tax=Staphylococcus chromogenes TaxID=46126 RepID=UPI000D1B7A35|nr:carbohydrate kinase [Staphylococcus chromogenes]PTG09249.1 carbohydrate kinase [Staphylococcus chromogenes]PTG17183.1 carbohydrate kinase [Staphylococcus chromogenes]
MGKLYAMGEALIDFIPQTKGVELKDVTGFEPQVGGAPTNVASCVAKLGASSSLITQLGEDAFGDLILETLQKQGVETANIKRTHEANTGLAFVSLTESGERDFAFYRNPSADMLLEPSSLNINFQPDDILHFCSVDLIPSPMKNTHEHIIALMEEADGTIIFDPNLRFPLWPSIEALKTTVLEFMPKAHILKIADEELVYLTGSEDPASLQQLFQGKTEIIIYTEGANGASIYTEEGRIGYSPGYKVDLQDTTGAGDAFVGAMIYQLLKGQNERTPIDYLKQHAPDILAMSNAVGALTTTKKGAIGSIPTLEEVQELLQK